MDRENAVLLQAQGIKTYFPVKSPLGLTNAQVKAVDGVNLTVHESETYGLVGETGCGKSTLGRTILGLVKKTEGSILFEGKNLSELSEKQMRETRRSIQMVFQDPFTSLDPRKRVGSALMETLSIHRVGKRTERAELAMTMLERVGLLPEHFYRFPHEFSGGQCQRIALARALILKPKFIICDEPVSALDISIQSQIINLLKELQKEEEVAYLFIAHDLSVIRHVSKRIGVMYLGHIVEEADTKELFSNPMHPYTRALLSSVPIADPHIKNARQRLEGDPPSPVNPPSGCPFHTRCPRATKLCCESIPEERNFGQHKVFCHLYVDDLSFAEL